MATEKEMYELLGRALVDATFRTALIADPMATAAGIGVNLSEEQAAAIKASDLTAAHDVLDERLSKRPAAR